MENQLTQQKNRRMLLIPLNIHGMKNTMSIQNYSRADRKKQVIMTIALSIQRGNGDELTSYRIARALGMKPSLHVTQILAEMVAEEKLKCRKVENRPGRWATYLYTLSDSVKPSAHIQPREISVKKNGKQVGQLELI